MKHTPGPWTVKYYPSGTIYIHMRNASGKDGPTLKGSDFSDQDGHVGAHTFLHNVPAFEALRGETEDQLREERVANAVLISAAPDLYAALEAERSGKPCGDGCCGGWRQCSGCDKRIQDALAKAGGKSQKG